MNTKKTFKQRFEIWWSIVDRPTFCGLPKWLDPAVKRIARKAYNLGRKHEREAKK